MGDKQNFSMHPRECSAQRDPIMSPHTSPSSISIEISFKRGKEKSEKPLGISKKIGERVQDKTFS